MHDAFAVTAAYGDVVAVPQLGALGAGGPQRLPPAAQEVSEVPPACAFSPADIAAAAAVLPPGTPEAVSTSTPERMRPAAAVLTPGDDVRVLTGHPARTFAAWVADNARTFA